MILPGGTAREQLEQAVLAERAGWDGVFVWEAAYGIDAWALLAAMAVRTTRVRLGTMLSPLPWRRPWKLASQVSTLDQLSDGRVIVSVGLGALTQDLPESGEVTDKRQRAELLDDGIDIMRALWAGESTFEGTRLRFRFERDDQLEIGRPVQERIPIWVVGAWPRPKSMRRVVRCDGWIPQFSNHEGSPGLVRAALAWLTEHGARSDLDVTAEGQTPPRGGQDEVAAWRDAGCTWWLESNWEMPHHSTERMAEIRERIEAGPPR